MDSTLLYLKWKILCRRLRDVNHAKRGLMMKVDKTVADKERLRNLTERVVFLGSERDSLEKYIINKKHNEETN